jgi:hypothetical protein
LSTQKRELCSRTQKKAKAPATEIEYLWDRLDEVMARIGERAIDREGREL